MCVISVIRLRFFVLSVEYSQSVDWISHKTISHVTLMDSLYIFQFTGRLLTIDRKCTGSKGLTGPHFLVCSQAEIDGWFTLLETLNANVTILCIEMHQSACNLRIPYCESGNSENRIWHILSLCQHLKPNKTISFIASPLDPVYAVAACVRAPASTLTRPPSNTFLSPCYPP